MHSREQYLETVREEYRRSGREHKPELLNEARKRTRLNRKVLIRKLAHPNRVSGLRVKRRRSYGAEVVTALIQMWELFDYACGQRLAAALRTEVPRLRASCELECSDEAADKLQKVSPSTIDRLLRYEKEVHGSGAHRADGRIRCCTRRSP